MLKIAKVVLLLPAILFVVLGLRWLIDPSASANALGFELGTGVGRSSQIGDLAAFFLSVGLCILMALVSARRVWFYPPVMLLLLAACGRVLAWVLHDAAFAGPMLIIEVGIAVLLLVVARLFPEQH